MESWDDDNFEPEVKVPAPVSTGNKWEGEDEEDDIKESWEDEEEEDKSKEETVERAVQKSKKKSLAEKIAEKERLKQEELERRRATAEDDDDLSPEERLRMQKDSDLKLALETTFGDAELLECPTTLEEFDEFANALIKKIQPLSKNSEFPNFAENLVRNICATLCSLDIKKIKNTVDNLYLEKQKVEKGDKAKKNKGKGKVKLKVEDSNQYSAYAVDDFDDFNDFM